MRRERKEAAAHGAPHLMTGPLEGLEVVQVVQVPSPAPAPFGRMVRADVGADVIRVERSAGGDALSVPSS